MRHMIILTYTVLTTQSAAAMNSENCQSFNHSIENSLMTIAAFQAEGVADNSAPRATVRQAKITNEWQKITANLMLTEAHACPLPTQPLETTKYLADATSCQTELTEARLKAIRSRTTPVINNITQPSCDRSTWGETK